MVLKALQTSLKSLNTKTSTFSTGNTLWGLMGTSVLSATWFYHLPLIDLRLLLQAQKPSLGIAAQFCGTSPAVPLLPWALTACPGLLGMLQPPSLPGSPTSALCSRAGEISVAPCQAPLQTTSILPAKRHKPLQGSSRVQAPSLWAFCGMGVFHWYSLRGKHSASIKYTKAIAASELSKEKKNQQ